MSLRYRPVENEAALVVEWRPYAYTIATDFHFPGGDFDDVRQEALVGLLIGIRMYQPDRGMTLKSFLAMSTRAWLTTKTQQANKMAAEPLTNAVRQARNDDGELAPVVELLPGGTDPHTVLVWREELARLARGMASLSPLEREWLTRFLNGGQYSFADKRSRNKRAENAIDRARLKLRDAA